MATATKKPQVPRKNRPKNGGYTTGTGKRQQKQRPISGGQRFLQRVQYILRHPVDSIWGLFSSVRTAIYIICAIAVICLIGVYFPQAPNEVLTDPTAYSSWVQLNELPKYGSLTPVFDWLQFFTIFSSWYFKLLLVILSFGIIVNTLNRVPGIWHNFAHPLIRRSDKFYENALERTEFAYENPVEWTRKAFQRRGFRVRSVVETNSSDPQNEVTYLYANKNSWATFSTFVFHAALVVLLLAGVVSQWQGLDPNSPARRWLPAPIVALSDSLAGFTFDQALPDGQSAIVYPRGTPHNISFRANHFTATFDSKTGQATDYVTDLSVYQDGELVAHSDHLRVNSPLAYGGIVFHQSSLIPSVNITITDKQGFVLFNEPVILDQSDTTQPGLTVDYAKGIPIASTNLTMSVLFPHSSALQMAQIKNPRIIIGVGLPGASLNNDKVALALLPGQSGQSVDKDWTVTLNSAEEATVLLVTKDVGASIVWPTAIILILSLCTTFYFPQKRIWIRIEGKRVQMASLREHFTNMRRELLSVQRVGTDLSSP